MIHPVCRVSCANLTHTVCEPYTHRVRTFLIGDLLEEYMTGLGGGRKFNADSMINLNPYSCCVMAGWRSNQERKQNLQAFKDGQVRFLICTDVAARGIDIKGLPYVLNMTLPDKVREPGVGKTPVGGGGNRGEEGWGGWGRCCPLVFDSTCRHLLLPPPHFLPLIPFRRRVAGNKHT